MNRFRAQLLLTFLPIIGLCGQSQPVSKAREITLPSDLAPKVRQNLRVTDKQQCLDDNHLRLEQAISTEWLNLNEAAGPVLLLKGLAPCFASGANGSILLYGQFYDGWRKILDGTGHQVLPLRSKTKGWGDLEFWQQQSASESIRRLYRFDGYEYLAAGCEMVQLADRATGKPLPKPISSRCPK